MNRNRLPSLNSKNPLEDSDILDSGTLDSSSTVTPKRKKRILDKPSNTDDERTESEARRNSRQLQKQVSLANSNETVPDQSPSEVATSSVKRSRKAKTMANTEQAEQLVSNVQRPKTNATKKKRRTNSRVIKNPVFVGDRGLVSELADLEEDIVDSATNAEPESSRDQTTAEVVVMRSEPTQKVYLEKSSGFKTANKTKLTVKRIQAADAVANATDLVVVPVNTVDFALSTHRVFKTITVFLQGLFAGLVLWQIISTQSLITFGPTAFSSYYFPLSIPFQSVYFFLSAVSCVAVLDRYDLANTTRHLLMRSVSFQAGTVCVIFYFSGLIISLGTAYLDEGIGLNQSTVLNDNTVGSGCNWLCQWQILNICRGVLGILGWFVISLSPTTDRLTKCLLRMNDDILQPIDNDQNNGLTKRSTPVESTVWTTA